MAGIKTPDCEGNKENNNERSNSNSDIDDQQENVLENGHGKRHFYAICEHMGYIVDPRVLHWSCLLPILAAIHVLLCDY